MNVEEITKAVGETFPSFGGGQQSKWNPIANALADKPLQFAAGVEIETVVRFVLERAAIGETNMSRSQPNDRIPNPSTRWHEWSGGRGGVRYFDKELKENVELKLPFEFILLDRLNSITGWHNASEAGIFANEIRDTRNEPFIVRSFKMADSIAEGFYGDIKDKIKANGGKFTVNLYIAFAETAGQLVLGSFRLHGAAMSAWFNFENDKANRPLLYKKGIRIKSTLHGEKGAGKNKIEWEAPVFEFYDVEEYENDQAATIDRDILQPYLISYFKRSRVEQAEPVKVTDEAEDRSDHDEPIGLAEDEPPF